MPQKDAGIQAGSMPGFRSGGGRGTRRPSIASALLVLRDKTVDTENPNAYWHMQLEAAIEACIGGKNDEGACSGS